jgi:hypothetical protein
MRKEENKMIPATGVNRSWVRRVTSRHPVKVTALFYLREALLDERYEDCPAAIEIAKEFGAQEFEIQDLIEDPRRKPR